MKKIAFAAVTTVFLACGGSAFAQASGAMSSNAMSHGLMFKDLMSNNLIADDGVNHDEMVKENATNAKQHNDKKKAGMAVGGSSAISK